MSEFNTEKEPTTPEAELNEPLVLPYEPFPSFADWIHEPIDMGVFDNFAEQLQLTKAASTESALADAVQTATRWAAVNTGAIEGLYEVDRGFTYTVAVSAAAWSDIHKIKGQAAANSMQDAVDAYEFVLDATTRAHPITEVWIRELHAIVTRTQETYTVITAVGPQNRPFAKGEYKSDSNSPLNIATNTVHSYAPPIDTPSEMARLMGELRTSEFGSAHPIVQAAYSHFAFVCIHPFADGNGRVSRALASVYLYRSPGVPLVIFADQKNDYLDALELADAGDHRGFVRFVSERAIDTVQMVRAEMSKGLVLGVSEQLAQLATVLSGRQGLPHTEIDAIAARLLGVFQAALDAQLVADPLLAPMTGSVQPYGMGTLDGLPNGFRGVTGNQSVVMLYVSSFAPAAGQEQRTYDVGVARPGVDASDFVIYSSTRVLLEVDLREVHPTVGPALVFRAESEAAREIRETVAGVAAQATNSLRSAGYLD